MNKQYFYLVALENTKTIKPLKIFLQEYQAIKWGRRKSGEYLLETHDFGYKYTLYRQEITTNGILEYIKDLIPYGSDFDIDKDDILR